MNTAFSNLGPDKKMFEYYTALLESEEDDGGGKSSTSLTSGQDGQRVKADGWWAGLLNYAHRRE